MALTALLRGRRSAPFRWSSTAALDDRDTVRAALRDAGHRLIDDAGDTALVAHAYAAWGPPCFERLSGEFAACVWDEARRAVVAARDRFGVKPLFHAAVPGGRVVASSLAAIRAWRGVSSQLADDAIADFLLFGELQDPRATCFAGVARVPPGGWTECSAGRAPRDGVYFRLGPVEPLRYREPQQYVEQFRQVLETAVGERVGTSPVTVMMSGGLDSSTVAAFAAGPGGAGADRCVAVTAVYDTLFADPEREFSSMTARALGLAIEHVPVDAYELFARWHQDAGPPEPSVEVLSAIMRDLLLHAGRHAGVALTGDGEIRRCCRAPSCGTSAACGRSRSRAVSGRRCSAAGGLRLGCARACTGGPRPAGQPRRRGWRPASVAPVIRRRAGPRITNA